MTKTKTSVVMDIDEIMNQFRLASRMLFNQFFHITNPYHNNGWVFEEQFSEAQKVIFQKLIIDPTSLQSIEYGDPHTQTFVNLYVGDFSPIMINRAIKSGYWGHPLTECTKDAN
jgi:hypothetical protein